MPAFRRLPRTPNLEHERKAAKALLRQLRAGDPEAVARARAQRPDIDFADGSTIKLADAQLIIAREYGFPSWARLVRYISRDVQKRQAEEILGTRGGWELQPLELARGAIAAADLAGLQHVVAAHPQLLDLRYDNGGRLPTLLTVALAFEARLGVDAMRPIMEWLATQGFDRQRALNEQLSGRIRMEPQAVRELLARGADPSWISDNGIPVLELALMNYWSGEAVDVLATATTPRRSLWIAAGLGDVAGVGNFLQPDGRPTKAAHRLRPQFDAAAIRLAPQSADASDEEVLLEALLIALLNGRGSVLEYMIARGAPIHSTRYGAPLMHIAVGNMMNDVVASMLRAGVEPDDEARAMARSHFEDRPEDDQRRRLVELLGMNPEALLAARDAVPPSPPALHPHFENAIRLASDDAVRHNQNEITPENLLFGMLRNREGGLMGFTRVSGMDLDRFRADMHDRMRAADDLIAHDPLPMDGAARAVVDRAIGIATERRRGLVNEFYLLVALLDGDDGVAGMLLGRYGGDRAKVLHELGRSL